MAKVRRIDRCPCRSGFTVKRCCSGNNGVADVHRLPVDILFGVVPDLVDLDKDELQALIDQLPYLPRGYPALRLASRRTRQGEPINPASDGQSRCRRSR
jgi:hypothetical protein